MAGVSVTDGKNITKTDEAGAFVLPGWERARLIYANVLTNRHDDWYQAIEPGRNSYDFCLFPAENAGGHCFLHFSDTEIFDMSDEECKPWLDFVREMGQQQKASFLMHGGDICGDIGLPRHGKLMNGETMGFPVRYCIGNHDYRGREIGESVYEQYYGPSWYSFDCGNVHYVVTAIRNGDYPSGYEPEDQWNWLMEDLQCKDPDQGLVLFNHGCCMGRFLREKNQKHEFHIDRQDREALLQENGLLAVIFGHLHLHYHGLCDGFHFICSNNPKMGGIDTSPSGMHLVQVSDDLQMSSRVLLFDERAYRKPVGALWTVQLPGNILHCSPVVYENSLIVGTVDDGWPKRCGIVRLSCQGEILWFCPTKNSVRNDLTVDNGRVYAQDMGGNVYALDIETGCVLWVSRTPLSGSRFDGSTGAVLYRGILFAGNSRQISALDVQTGRLLWTSRENLFGENTAISPVFWQDRLIMGGTWEQLYALDIHTGEELWRIDDSRCRFFYATPLVDADTLIVPAKQHLCVIDPAQGRIIQAVEIPEYCLDSSARPVRDGDMLYVSTVTNGVLALDAKTFAVQKQYSAGRCLTYTSGYSMRADATVDGQVLTDDRYIHFAGSDGWLYTYEKQSGILEDRQEIGAPALVQPVFFGGGIAAADIRGWVSLFPRKNAAVQA